MQTTLGKLKRKVFFFAVLSGCFLCCGTAAPEFRYEDPGSPSMDEVSDYMNYMSNPVSEAVDEGMSLPEGLGSQSIPEQIAVVNAEMNAILGELMGAISDLQQQAGAIAVPPPPLTLTASCGRWTLVATHTKTLFGSMYLYEVTSAVYSGQAFSSLTAAMNAITGDLAQRIARIYAGSYQSVEEMNRASGKYTLLSPLSSNSKLGSKFGFNFPGTFDRWIDGLVPGEFKHLGPPFPRSQLQKIKEMQGSIEEAEQIAREKKQQEERFERIEKDRKLTKLEKEYAEEYLDSTMVDLSGQEGALFADLYGDLEEFDSIEKEGEESLFSMAGVPPLLSYEMDPEVDDTAEGPEEPGEPGLLEEIWSDITTTAEFTAQTGLDVWEELKNAAGEKISYAENLASGVGPILAGIKKWADVKFNPRRGDGGGDRRG